MSLSFEKILEQTPKPKLTRSYACCCKEHDESCCRPISEILPPIEKYKRCLGECDGCFRICMIDEKTHKCQKCEEFTPLPEGLLLKALLSLKSPSD